jgi:hypothetical protein
MPRIAASWQSRPKRKRGSRSEPAETLPNQSLYESLKARQSRPECQEIRQIVSQLEGLKKADSCGLFVI